MKITIELDVYPEGQDVDHEMGITEEAHDSITRSLAAWGDIGEIRVTER